MWLACLAIAVDHISTQQAVQENQYAKFNIRTGNTISSYIFSELQMTSLDCTFYFRNAFFKKEKELSCREICKCIGRVTLDSIITVYFK